MAEGNASDEEPIGTTPALPSTPAPHRRRFGLIVLVAGAVLVVALVVAASISVPYEAIVPGSGIDVATLITVPKQNNHVHKGAILLTDVDLVPLNALNYYYYRHKANTEVVPINELTGGVSNAQYNDQGVIDMALARQAATVVGLRALGYHIQVGDQGAIVYAISPGSPAAHELAIGDVITSVNGRAVSSIQGLHAVLATLRPGQKVQVVQHHFVGSSTVSSTDALKKPKSKYYEVTLGEMTPATSSDVAGCRVLPKEERPAPARGATACLGVVVKQAYKTAQASLPVTMQANGIVGPSAGLAFTLGLIAKLDPASLTNGLRIAATGTMAVNGAVGDVGGVAQKTVAVRAAHANVFFVPPQELKVAKANAGSALRVFAVSSLSEALSDLEHLGGKLTRGPSAH